MLRSCSRLAHPHEQRRVILSPTSHDVIEATLPAVEAHIGAISERFYERLFAAAPHLCTDLFNRTNQRNREQQKALASSIAAFAKLLVTEKPEDIDPIMARIANKHASIGIQAGHYEMIRFHLFAAIGEVLGPAVTPPEVAAAWHQVYTLMAGSLIAQEAALYNSVGGVPHGHVWRLVVVSEVEYDGARVATFVLRSLDGRPLPPDFLPGQYISICVRLPDGTRQIRQYTLVRGRASGEWAVTIKRVPGGLVSPVPRRRRADGHRADRVAPPVRKPARRRRKHPIGTDLGRIGITSTLTVLQNLAETNPPLRRVVALHVDHSPPTIMRAAPTSPNSSPASPQFPDAGAVQRFRRIPRDRPIARRRPRPSRAPPRTSTVRWRSCARSGTGSSAAESRSSRFTTRRSRPGRGSASTDPRRWLRPDTINTLRTSRCKAS